MPRSTRCTSICSLVAARREPSPAVVEMIFGLALALPIATLILPFWLVSLLTRAIAAAMEPPHLSWPEVMRFDASVGWRPRANLDLHHLALRDEILHIRTDAEGWVGESSIESSDLVARRVGRGGDVG